jgi:tripartite-type tricarboxylate transporter receptor subunit TctC
MNPSEEDAMKQRVLNWMVGIGLMTLLGAAFAQYPNKPVRIVVPFPAGSATDTVGRILANSLSTTLGQPVIVESKAGADGAIAAAEVAKAPADGYTLLLATNSPMAAVPALRKQPPYDPTHDFTPISAVGRYTFFLYVNSQVPARTLQELIDYTRANPGKLAYATGNTTGIVSTAQLLALGGKLNMLHVPYKGEPAGITDLVSNRVQVMFATPTTGAHARDGKLRMIATSLPRRSAIAPEVPTFAEAGMPRFSIVSWAALYGPAKLPRDIVERMNREVNTALNRADVKEQLDRQQFFGQGSTPEELAIYTKEQMEVYARILRDSGVQPE